MKRVHAGKWKLTLSVGVYRCIDHQLQILELVARGVVGHVAELQDQRVIAAQAHLQEVGFVAALAVDRHIGAGQIEQHAGVLVVWQATRSAINRLAVCA